MLKILKKNNNPPKKNLLKYLNSLESNTYNA